MAAEIAALRAENERLKALLGEYEFFVPRANLTLTGL